MISGNSGVGSQGVYVTGTGTSNNAIEGNLIGLAADGTDPRWATPLASEVYAGPSNTSIGGTVAAGEM